MPSKMFINGKCVILCCINGCIYTTNCKTSPFRADGFLPRLFLFSSVCSHSTLARKYSITLYHSFSTFFLLLRIDIRFIKLLDTDPLPLSENVGTNGPMNGMRARSLAKNNSHTAARRSSFGTFNEKWPIFGPFNIIDPSLSKLLLRLPILLLLRLLLQIPRIPPIRLWIRLRLQVQTNALQSPSSIAVNRIHILSSSLTFMKTTRMCISSRNYARVENYMIES